MPFCSSCGKEIQAEETFCKWCGHKLRQISSEPEKASIGKKPQMNLVSKIKPILSIISFIAFILLAASILGPTSQRVQESNERVQEATNELCAATQNLINVVAKEPSYTKERKEKKIQEAIAKTEAQLSQSNLRCPTPFTIPPIGELGQRAPVVPAVPGSLPVAVPPVDPAPAPQSPVVQQPVPIRAPAGSGLQKYVFTGQDTVQKKGSIVSYGNDANSTRPFTITTRQFRVSWNTTQYDKNSIFMWTIHVSGQYCVGVFCREFDFQLVDAIPKQDDTSKGSIVIDREKWSNSQLVGRGQVNLHLWVKAFNTETWVFVIEELG